MSSVFLLSLGCDKNLTDSEKLLYNLSEAGLELTDDPQDADYAVVNTCCFTEDAKKESIQGIMELSEIKQQGKLKEIIVAGCMAERYMDSLSDMMPEADHIIPLSSFYDIPGLISGENGGVERTGNAVKKGGYSRLGADLSFLTGASARGVTGTGALARVITTGGVYDYLKIADGCDRNCSYCAIPMIRGHYHSVPEEQLLAEARGMALRGIKELILVAQETTLYGADIYGRKSLPELLKKLCDIRELEHIRLLYAYPESVDKDL
ncbi:MAG: radical SAM protein, partial [Lachnospiraceae bacterium]|nr:radical SAM protein [Lachnospiraceae bacterium]